MLGYKIRQMNNGDIKTDAIRELTVIPKINPKNATRITWYIVKRGSHVVIMQAIKGWVYVSHKASEAWYKPCPKKEPAEKTENPMSHFLGAMREYKGRIRHMRNQLKQKDEEKKEEEGGRGRVESLKSKVERKT